MAAALAGLALGVPMDCIRRALRSFVAVEHRIEYVATKRGVKYYNDSKGTNPDASIQAVRAMTTNTLLIGGGYDKGSEYGEWIDSFEGKVTWLGSKDRLLAQEERRIVVIFVCVVVADAVHHHQPEADKEQHQKSACCFLRPIW